MRRNLVRKVCRLPLLKRFLRQAFTNYVFFGLLPLLAGEWTVRLVLVPSFLHLNPCPQAHKKRALTTLLRRPVKLS